ncbi:TetR/AcrR family transcriptional regulator [Phytohabitans rumicis]|uniref:TetR family transcriptional regulator n=1 Tax=Phytohabitans rumicis TaxID=1076125 RepID=A0A6V8LHR2_9ACTN|nr:TetR family transcriptional regulator [Phytohabitans rumicis]GFJ93647.1 TetR family transcriptional regulator [Phytohabitans rumicis]
MDDKSPLPLRERKHRRTREAIIEAAMTLFAERGFDGVTVTDIAQRAEVGRSTFFRYFTDKQEVLFADDAELRQLLIAACERVAADLAPLGTCLADALAVTRAGLLALTGRIAERSHWLPVRERLIGERAELRARTLLKERGYVEAGIDVLQRHGAAPATALLATNLAAACYAAAHAQTLATGKDLPAALDEAFSHLAGLDTRRLRDRLD